MASSGRLRRRLSQKSLQLSERISERRRSKSQPQSPEVVEVRKKLLLFNEFIIKVESATLELLQPNPHARTKVAWKTSYSRAAGSTAENPPKYPHAEGGLAKRFSKFAERLNDATAYTAALRSSGRSFHQLCAAKRLLDVEVREKFLYPFLVIQEKELQPVVKSHLKTSDGKAVDGADDVSIGGENEYTDENVFDVSVDMFSETKEQEYVGLLLELTTALKEFHRKCAVIMETLVAELAAMANEVQSQSGEEKTSNEQMKTKKETTAMPTKQKDGYTLIFNNSSNNAMTSFRGGEMGEGIYKNCDPYQIDEGGANKDKIYSAYSPYKIYAVAPKRCSVQYGQNVVKNVDASTMYGEATKKIDPPSFSHNIPCYF